MSAQLSDGAKPRHAEVLHQYLLHLRNPRSSQATRPRWCDLHTALEGAIDALSSRQQGRSQQEVIRIFAGRFKVEEGAPPKVPVWVFNSAQQIAAWFEWATGDRKPEDWEQASRRAGRHGFQGRVARWMARIFQPSLYCDMTERGDRLLEEVLELLQSKGYDPARVQTLVDYVYGRPVGEPAQEVGGVMVTLAAYCSMADLDMLAEGARELSRIEQPEIMERIRKKQEAKRALCFDTPLPGNSDAKP